VPTAQGILSCALLVALPIGHAGDGLDEALDSRCHCHQGVLNQELHFRKGFSRLHAVLPDTLEAFRDRMLNHMANKRADSGGRSLKSR
jgi:hypothetical protein